MAKVSIKSEKITPFGGIFHVRELYSRYVGPVIDKVLETLGTGDRLAVDEGVGVPLRIETVVTTISR